MGLFDSITGIFFGDAPEAKPSGAFPSDRLKKLGGSYGDFLINRLNTPAEKTMQFYLGKQAIRDALDEQGATARQRLGDTAVAGGFLDSGGVLEGMTDIERAQAQAYAGEITNLLLALEDRREQNVLPFLSQGAGEAAQLSGLNIQSGMAQDRLLSEYLQSIGSIVPG